MRTGLGWIAAMWISALVLPSAARADAVFSLPCPFGARERTSHSGPRCAPWSCTADSECDSGLVCRPWRLCVQTHGVHPGGRSAFRDPPPPPTEEAQVVGSCEPSAACTGNETPRPPTSGQAIGEVRCGVANYCTRPPLPSLPAPPATDPNSEGASPADTSPAPPAANGSACGCRTAGRGSSGAFALAACVALFIRRRSR